MQETKEYKQILQMQRKNSLETFLLVLQRQIRCLPYFHIIQYEIFIEGTDDGSEARLLIKRGDKKIIQINFQFNKAINGTFYSWKKNCGHKSGTRIVTFQIADNLHVYRNRLAQSILYEELNQLFRGLKGEARAIGAIRELIAEKYEGLLLMHRSSWKQDFWGGYDIWIEILDEKLKMNALAPDIRIDVKAFKKVPNEKKKMNKSIHLVRVVDGINNEGIKSMFDSVIQSHLYKKKIMFL